MSKAASEKPIRFERITNMSKPVSMKLFAAWEVDRTPSDCIPRYEYEFMTNRFGVQSPLFLFHYVSLCVSLIVDDSAFGHREKKHFNTSCASHWTVSRWLNSSPGWPHATPKRCQPDRHTMNHNRWTILIFLSLSFFVCCVFIFIFNRE